MIAFLIYSVLSVVAAGITPNAKAPAIYPVRVEVTDYSGKSVSGAFIEALAITPPENRLARGLTKEDGVLVMQLSPGTWRFYASKVSAGVPDARALLFQPEGARFPEVRIISAQVNPVKIKLPPPFGCIHMKVVNAESGVPLTSARIRLSLSGDPSIFYEGNVGPLGSYLIQLPPRATTVTVTTPGFKPWSADKALYLQPGTEGELTAALEPDH